MKILGVMLYLLGICSGLVALSITYLLWLHNPVGLPCRSVSYDGTLNIEYGFGGKKASFLNGGSSLLLAGGTGHHHGPFPITMFDGLPSGSPMHLEFCGHSIVRLNSDGHEVKLTQKNAEDNRMRGIRQTGAFGIFALLAAILGRWLARRAPDA
jgi:hypothetical protein